MENNAVQTIADFRDFCKWKETPRYREIVRQQNEKFQKEVAREKNR